MGGGALLLKGKVLLKGMGFSRGKSTNRGEEGRAFIFLKHFFYIYTPFKYGNQVLCSANHTLSKEFKDK